MGAEEELIDDEEADELNFVAIGIAAVIVLAIIGGLVWFFVLKEEPTEEEAGPKIPEWEAPLDLTPELVYDDLDRLIINPADSRGRYYLVVKVDIAFQRDVRGELLSRLWVIPQAKNLIIDIFSDYTIAELQKSEFKEEARMEILYEFNRLMGWEGDLPSFEELEVMEDDDKPPVKDIYLVEFILN